MTKNNGMVTPPPSPYSAVDSGAEPYMHCLDEDESDTFVALPSPEELDLEEQLMEVEALAAAIVQVPKIDGKKAKKDASSGPPSPPDSGSTTPRVTIAPSPVRFKSYIPPPNYGTVELHKVFRSSFPQDRHMDFVKKLRIRSILTLVGTEPTQGFAEWLNDEKIMQLRVDIAPNKEGVVNTSLDSLCEAVLFVMDSRNHPLYIHCNQGKHRTGCVVACLRKIQGMPIEDIIAEYRTYSEPKARPGDIELIKSFDPEVVFQYARAHGYLNGAFSGLKRPDSLVNINNIDTLAAALAAGAMTDQEEDVDMALVDVGSSSVSECSSTEGLEMIMPRSPRNYGTTNGINELANDKTKKMGTTMDVEDLAMVDGALEDQDMTNDTTLQLDPALEVEA